MAWVVFTPAEFAAWHDAECAARGIPRPGRIQKTGTVAVDNEWTTAFVQPAYKITVSGNTYYLADVPDATGLQTLTSLTRNADGSITAVYKGKSYTVSASGVDATKPKPQTVVIDGVTYTRTR